MFMLNKVRNVSEGSFYEILEYDVSNPGKCRIITVDKEGFTKALTYTPRDYDERNGYLISTAETVNMKALPCGEIIMERTNRTLFDFVWELISLDAYFIPRNLYNKGNVESSAHFSNIRISNSTMFMGFSMLVNDVWSSYTIMSVDDLGHIAIKPFYIAVPVSKDSLGWEPLEVLEVNGKVCNVYEYRNQYSVFPSYKPFEYVPLPIINYLMYNQMMYKIACDFTSDMLEDSGIKTSSDRPSYTAPKKVVSVSPSIKVTSRERRALLMKSWSEFGGDIKEFIEFAKLNDFEEFVFTIFSRLTSAQIDNELPALLRKLRVARSMYSLPLMEWRCKFFSDPTLFGDRFVQIIAEGGYAGFHTIIKRI